MMHKYCLIIFCFCTLTAPLFLLAQNTPNDKKLIEFGWDMPKISFLKNHIGEMEKMPFDGVVFTYDFHIFNAFDTTYRGESVFQYDDLKNVHWKKFTDNFLLVRGAGFTGPHWLSDADWDKIVVNLKKVSGSLAGPNIKGIGFDAEYYFKEPEYNPWVYKPSLYNNLSYEQVGNIVRRRGTQFIQALQSSKPDIKILCFWLLGWVAMQNNSASIDQTAMALLPFFVEGMLAGKNPAAQIIDGNENSYMFMGPENFIMSGISLRYQGTKLVRPSYQAAINQVPLAHAIYLDKIFGYGASLEKRYNMEIKKNWLADNLYAAYKTSDKYVWMYDQKTNWWQNQTDTTGASVIAAVREKINAEQNNSAPILTGVSMVYNPSNMEAENYQGFNYRFNKSKKLLNIQLLNSNIEKISVFANSRLIYEAQQPSGNLSIDLSTKYKTGNIILIAKDKGITSYSFVN